MVNLSFFFSHARVTLTLQVNWYQHVTGEDKPFRTNRHEAFNPLTNKTLWMKTMISEPSWLLHPTSRATDHQKLHASKAHPELHTE